MPVATTCNRRRFLIGLTSAAAAAALPRIASAADKPPLRMAYFETYSPLSFRDGEKMRGIIIDVLDEVIGKRLGVAIEHTGFPWVRAQAMVQQGEYDGICTIATPARLEYAVAASEPVVIAPTRIFVRGDHPKLAELRKVGSLDELRKLHPNVLSYAGNGWAKEKLANFDVVWGGTFDSALLMLIAQRGDLMIENAITMQYTLPNTPGGQVIRMLPNALDEARFQLLLGKHSPHQALLPAFDKAIRQFRREPGYKSILARYGISL